MKGMQENDEPCKHPLGFLVARTSLAHMSYDRTRRTHLEADTIRDWYSAPLK